MAFPTFRIEGKIALVTGAAQGIGRSIARGLANAGASVACADLDERALLDVARDLDALGRPGLPLLADVADPAAIGRMVASVGDR
jgi:NAD(P)-dependent dehydrogenase (short-subunit alcohol dehydrogenase family)